MEEYIREALRVVTVPNEQLLQLTYRPEEDSSEETKISSDEPEPPAAFNFNAAVPNVDITKALTPQNNFETGDLLGLDYNTDDASTIEDRNALALAIVPSDPATAPTFDSNVIQAKDFDPTGWELALATTPSSNISSVNERQLAGGLDTLILNSLYDEGAYRAAQQPVYGAPTPNPFEAQDPFAFSSSIAPPPAVQMATMAQQQANPFGPYQPTFQQQPPPQHIVMAPTNHFGDAAFGAFPVNSGVHPQTNNPFGTTGLI